MKLPQLDAPKYRVKLLSIPDEIEYRPFLVKEQKVLLMAAQSKDPVEIVDAMKGCITACTFGKVNVDTLPSFDLIMMFIKIRAKSVGEVLELKYTCDNKIHQEDGESKTCGNEIDFRIDLEGVDYTVPEKHSSLVELTDTVGLRMRYPTIQIASKYDNLNDPSQQLGMAMDCIESVYSDDSIVEASELSKEELTEFIDSFSTEQLEKVLRFFHSQPSVNYRTDLACSKCGAQRTLTLNDLEDFF